VRWIIDWFADSAAQTFSSSIGRNRPAWVELAVYIGCLLLFSLMGIGLAFY